MNRHPRRNRHKLTFTDEEAAKVSAMCEELYRFMPTATALRRIVIEVADNIDAFREVVTRVPNGPQRAPTDPCPDPARAPVTCQERERERENKHEDDGGDPLVAEWKTVEPFCLLKNPTKTLERCRRAFPDVNMDAETALIGQWWDERPDPRPNKPRRDGERWTRDGISQGIRGWLGRVGKGPNGTRPKKSITQKQAEQQQFDELPEGWS